MRSSGDSRTDGSRPQLEHARISTQLTPLLDAPARAAGLLLAMSEFNLGESEHDFRVPDGGLNRPGAAGVWHATAAAVVEILSPDDASRQKLPFYAEHDVDEVLLVDPAEPTVRGIPSWSDAVVRIGGSPARAGSIARDSSCAPSSTAPTQTEQWVPLALAALTAATNTG